jgi:hypothetical protein
VPWYRFMYIYCLLSVKICLQDRAGRAFSALLHCILIHITSKTTHSLRTRITIEPLPTCLLHRAHTHPSHRAPDCQVVSIAVSCTTLRSHVSNASSDICISAFSQDLVLFIFLFPPAGTGTDGLNLEAELQGRSSSDTREFRPAPRDLGVSGS